MIPKVKTGIELIAEERWEQVYKHGFDNAHDSQHNRGEISIAAAALAIRGTDAHVTDPTGFIDEDTYMDEWGLVEYIKDNRLKALVTAGALIAAEIDRLQNEK